MKNTFYGINNGLHSAEKKKITWIHSGWNHSKWNRKRRIKKIEYHLFAE